MQRKHGYLDFYVIVLAMLLLVSLKLFFVGIFPYPFGLFVITALLLARLSALYLANRGSGQ